MAANFGVQLKKSDGGKSGTQIGNTKRPLGVRREFQSKPMSDIKAMFEKGAEGPAAKPPEPGTNFAKKNITTQNQNSTTAKATKSSAIKTKSNVTPSNQKREAFQKGDKLSVNDLAAFDMLKHEIETKGVDHLDDKDELLPAVAVAKVYDGGHAYKATIEKKGVTKTRSVGGGTEVSKTDAVSKLSFGLTKLRTRPGSFCNEEKNAQPSLLDNTDSIRIESDKTDTDATKEEVKHSSAIKNKLGDNKYMPGVPRGWKSNVDEKSGRSSPLLDETKIKSDVTDTKKGHSSVLRAVNPLTRNSSSDSSTGNLSPQGYKTRYTQEHKRSNSPSSALNADVNRNVKPDSSGKFIAARANEISKVNESKVDKSEDLETIRSRLKPTEDLKRDNKTNNKPISNLSSISKQDTSLNDKNKANLEGIPKQHSRISRSSSTESSSSWTKTENLGIKSKLDRSGSPEPQKSNSSVGKSGSIDPRSKRKPGFEIAKENQDQTVQLRKKVGIIPAKKILEKRESLENPETYNKKAVKKEIASPISRKKLLEQRDSFEHPERHRKCSEPSEVITNAEKGRVIQIIKSLNEPEEVSKPRPSLKRRSRFLPSSGMEDDVESSGYYEDVEHEHVPFYNDIHGVRYTDDASSEGDISSEADVFYEEIPALKAGKETRFTNRRATAVKNKRELERRPVSSAYIQALDLATVPEPRSISPPFEDVLKFKSQYEEDGLSIDMSDDQVYGTMGNRYKSKLEWESLNQLYEYSKDKFSRARTRKRNAVYRNDSIYWDTLTNYYKEESDSQCEKINEHLSDLSSGSSPIEDSVEDKTAKKMSKLEMFVKKGTVLRALWAEMPEVKTSGVLETISDDERKMQESMFEIITSEATYLKSLNVLFNVFLLSKEIGSDLSDRGVLTRQERDVVFSNIGTIRDASEQFLSDLESLWQESIMITNVCDIIRKHASKSFECYVHYCSNKTFQDKEVTALKKKQDFAEALRRLESDPECQSLQMTAFLLLPMQRITRLPLLVDAICHRMDPIDDKKRHNSAIKALDAVNKVVKRCNDGAKKTQQTEQMRLIAKQLDFRNKDMTQIRLISSSRYLVKQGELTRIMSDSGSRLPFGKAKAGKQATYVFLCNDILLITKKKSNQYVVTDYSMRNTIHVETLESQEKMARYLPLGVPGGCKNLFRLVMLENYDKKMIECVFACNSVSDRARWMEAVTPVKVSDDHERIYEEWDCPQVQCVKEYVPTEPDELGLQESDVVSVFKKLEDGWFEGERMRDSERGWFPKEHVVEIVDAHVRARNQRNLYRLINDCQ